MSDGYKNQTRINNKLSLFLLSILLAIFVFLRVKIYFGFARTYTDSDQALLWYTAKEIMHGRFHEPCFYGQAYNSWIEALLAVPLIALGVSYSCALPLISSLLFLLSILFLVDLLRKESTLAATVFLSMILMLPAEFHYITSIPRGFVTGISVATLGLWLFNKMKSPYRFLVLSFGYTLGFVLNPNAVFLFFLIPENELPAFNRKNKNLKILALGILLGLLPYFYAKIFYHLHPDYIIHHSDIFRFKAKNYLDTLPKIESEFSPAFFLRSPLFTFSTFLLSFLWLLRFKDFKRGAVLAFLAVAALLGMDKAKDSNGTLFLPAFRSLLALPLYVAWNFSHLTAKPPLWEKFMRLDKVNTLFFSSLIVLGTWAGVSNIAHLNDDLRPLLDNSSYTLSNSQLSKKCDELESVMQANHLELFVVPTDQSLLGYACPVLNPKIESLVTGYERRVWHCNEEKRLNRTGFFATELEKTEVDSLSKAGIKVTPFSSESLSASLFVGHRLEFNKPTSVLDVLALAQLDCRKNSTAQ